MSDEDFTLYINNLDTNAELEVREGLVKTRKYNKKIIEDLKERYYYRCQICGYNSMDKYGVSVVEGHHLEEFSLTQNNKPENILIVCPNHQRLIHNAKGVFDRKQLQIVYYNGAVELINTNSHL